MGCFLQAYLHSHNRPHLSLHEEMVRREREREREERRRQQEEIEASRLKEKERVQYCSFTGKVSNAKKGVCH